MNQKPKDSGGVAVHSRTDAPSTQGQSSGVDPLDPKQFDPDWARNKPAEPPPAKPAAPAPAPTLPLKRTTPAGSPTLVTPPQGSAPKGGSIPGFGLAQKAGKNAPPLKNTTPGKGNAQHVKPVPMAHGHGRATPAGGVSHMDLQMADEPKREEANVEDMVAPALPEGVALPHLEVTPQADPKDDKPREKIDFEHLPEFVAQRRMLRNAKIAAILGTLVLLACVIYFGFFAGKKTVVPIIKDLGTELGKDKTTDELIKSAEDKK